MQTYFCAFAIIKTEKAKRFFLVKNFLRKRENKRDWKENYREQIQELRESLDDFEALVNIMDEEEGS